MVGAPSWWRWGIVMSGTAMSEAVALQRDYRKFTKRTAPMPDVVEYLTCGCDKQLCERHEGFIDGYRAGYLDALGVSE